MYSASALIGSVVFILAKTFSLDFGGRPYGRTLSSHCVSKVLESGKVVRNMKKEMVTKGKNHNLDLTKELPEV